MDLVEEAFQDPRLWTRDMPFGGQFIVRHPNGTEMLVQRSKGVQDVWRVRAHGLTPKPIGALDPVLAFLPALSPQRGLDGLVEDVLRITGPEVRAAWDAVLTDVRIWALSLQEDQQRLYLLRQDGQVVTSPRGVRRLLPPALRPRVHDLHAVQLYDATNRRMSSRARILLELPTTAHGLLALHAQARQHTQGASDAA